MPSSVPSLRFQWLRWTRPWSVTASTVGVPRPRRRVHREAVVVAGDRDGAGGEVLDRLVHAPVAERHLVGASAEREPQQLVPQADPEDRDLAEQVATRPRRRTAVAAGSPGPFERNTPSKPPAAISAAGVCAGKTVVSMPWAASSRRMFRFMPRSTAATRRTGPWTCRAGPTSSAASYGSAVRDRPREVGARHPRRCRARGRRARPARGRRSRSRRASRPASRMRRVSARVSIPSIPITPRRRAVLRGCRRPASCDARRDASRTANPATWIRPALGVGGVHAVVALMRRGHRHDLARVRRVGQDLLVAGHPGVEDGLAERLALGAEPRSPEDGAVLEGQERGRRRHRVAFPSETVSSPCSTVYRTRPRSARPVKALFLRLRHERRLDGPALVGIEHHEVGRAPALDRAAVVARTDGSGPASTTAPPIARDSGEEAGRDELRQRDRERRLEADRAGRRSVELGLLLLDRVRRVVGGDRVDRAVGEPLRGAPRGPRPCAAAGSSSGWCRRCAGPRR